MVFIAVIWSEAIKQIFNQFWKIISSYRRCQIYQHFLLPKISIPNYGKDGSNLCYAFVWTTQKFDSWPLQHHPRLSRRGEYQGSTYYLNFSKLSSRLSYALTDRYRITWVWTFLRLFYIIICWAKYSNHSTNRTKSSSEERNSFIFTRNAFLWIRIKSVYLPFEVSAWIETITHSILYWNVFA